MRKYFLLLSSCLTLTLGAQNELILDKSDDNVVRPVQLVNLSKDANGNYTAIIMTQLAAYTLNTTGILIHGAETHYVNELRTLSFNNSGAFTGATGVFYSKDGRSMKIGDIVNSYDISTSSFSDIKGKYPSLFIADDFLTIQGGIGSVDIIENQLDLFTLCYEKKNSRVVRISHPDQEADKKILTYSHSYLADEQNGYITTYYGRKDIVNDENKYNELKDYDFITYNDAGAVINRFNVKFPFPRQIDKIYLVFSEDDPSKSTGKLYVFQRAMLFGKKYNDPEKNNFDVVYLSNDGKLILHKTSKLGTIEKPLITVDAAYGNSNSVKLLVNLRANDTLKVGIVQINADGSEKISLITNQEMKNATLFVKDPKSMPVIDDRKILGFGNETPGYKFSFSNAYIVQGIAKASNGDLFLYGQMKYEIDDPNAPAPQQPGTATMTTTPKINKYGEFICIQIGADNMPKKFYISDLPITGEMNTFSVLSDESGKIIFTIPVPLLKAGDMQIRSKTFYTMAGAEVSAYNKSYLYFPKLCVVDPVTLQANSAGYAEDYFLFHLKKSFMIDQAGKKIVIAGFSRDAKADKIFVLRTTNY